MSEAVESIRPTIKEVRGIITSLSLDMPSNDELKLLSKDTSFHQSICAILNKKTSAGKLNSAKNYIKGAVICLPQSDSSHGSNHENESNPSQNKNTLKPTSISIAPIITPADSKKTTPVVEKKEIISKKEISSDIENPILVKTDKKYLSYTIFSEDAAISVNTSKTKDGYHTIMLNAAKKTGPKLDWDNKVSFQLTYRELHDFYAVLKQYNLEVNMNNHNAKSSSAKWQKGEIKLSMTTKEFTISVFVICGDIAILTGLIMHQLKLNYSFMSATEIEKMINDSSIAIQKSLI
jgi:hypothetical protein